MLDLYVYPFSCFRFINKIILLSCVALSTCTPSIAAANSGSISPIPPDKEHITTSYLSRINEDSTISEAISFLTDIREYLIDQGYMVLPLEDLCLGMRNYLVQQGIFIDDEEMETLYEEISRQESSTEPSFQLAINTSSKYNLDYIKSSKKKDGKETKIKSKMMFGFIKCLAGGLICIIPFAPVQAAGAGLVMSGINDCIDSAREQGDENEHIQQMDEQRRRESQQDLNI